MKLEDFFDQLQQAVNTMDARLKNHHLQQVKDCADDHPGDAPGKLKTLTFELPGPTQKGNGKLLRIPTIAISPPRMMVLESVKINLRVPLSIVNGEVHVSEIGLPADDKNEKPARRKWFDETDDNSNSENHKPVDSEIEILLKPTAGNLPTELQDIVELDNR